MSNRRKLPGGHDDHSGGRILRAVPDSEGHSTVILEGPDGPDVRRVCELVAGAFIGQCPEGHHLEHINGNLGDNSAANLRYVPDRA